MKHQKWSELYTYMCINTPGKMPLYCVHPDCTTSQGMRSAIINADTWLRSLIQKTFVKVLLSCTSMLNSSVSEDPA